MLVETHVRLGQAQKVKATRAVIYDDFGNAVAIALEVAPGVIHFQDATGKDFKRLLSLLGIQQTTVSRLDPGSREITIG
jgi:hypothetical protein